MMTFLLEKISLVFIGTSKDTEKTEKIGIKIVNTEASLQSISR